MNLPPFPLPNSIHDFSPSLSLSLRRCEISWKPFMWKPCKCWNSPFFAELIYWRDQREQRVHSMGFITRHAHTHTHKHIRLMLFTSYHLVSVYLAFSHSSTPPHRAAWAGTKARWEAALPGRELSGILLCGPRARWGERDNLQCQEGKHTT